MNGYHNEMGDFDFTTMLLRPICVHFYFVQTFWFVVINLLQQTSSNSIGERFERDGQSNATNSVRTGLAEEDWFAANWPWVVLLVLLGVASCAAGVCLVLCCALRRSTHLHQQQAEISPNDKTSYPPETHLLSHSNSPQKLSSGNSSSTCVLGGGANSFIEEHSARVSSSSLYSIDRTRRKYPSPGHSSGSKEGLEGPPERALPLGRLGRRSGSLVHVSAYDESDLSIVSVPSLASVDTYGNSASASTWEAPQPTVIEVNVTVGGRPGSERESQLTTAAALAESAAKLAQSATAMRDPSDDMWEVFQKRNGEWMMRYRATATAAPHPVTSGGCSSALHPSLPTTTDISRSTSDSQHDFLYQMRVNGVGSYGSHSKFPSRVPSQSGSLSPFKTVTCSPNYNPYVGGEYGGASPSLSHISRRLSYQNSDYDRLRGKGGHLGSCSPKRRSFRGPFSHSRSTNGGSTTHSPTRELRPLGRRTSHESQTVTTTTSVTVESVHNSGAAGKDPGCRTATESGSQNVHFTPQFSGGKSPISSGRHSHTVATGSQCLSGTFESDNPNSQSHLDITQTLPHCSRQSSEMGTLNTSNCPVVSYSSGQENSDVNASDVLKGGKEVRPSSGSPSPSRRSSASLLEVATNSCCREETKTLSSSSRSASSDNLHSRRPQDEAAEELEGSSGSRISSSQLKRQSSVPNFKNASHPAPPASTAASTSNARTSLFGVKQSSFSLARTLSGLSMGGVESAHSGYLASDGSSLTLDVEGRNSMISRESIGSGDIPSPCPAPFLNHVLSGQLGQEIDIDLLLQSSKKRSPRVLHEEGFPTPCYYDDPTPLQSPNSGLDFYSQTSTDGVEV